MIGRYVCLLSGLLVDWCFGSVIRGIIGWQNGWFVKLLIKWLYLMADQVFTWLFSYFMSTNLGH